MTGAKSTYLSMGPKASLAPSGTTNESGHSPVTVGLLVKRFVIRFPVGIGWM
jgi:hypothetical protein